MDVDTGLGKRQSPSPSSSSPAVAEGEDIGELGALQGVRVHRYIALHATSVT